VKIEVETARMLAGLGNGQVWDGFEVVENRWHDEKRWTSVQELVVKGASGQLYRAFYEQGLTENQDTSPFDEYSHGSGPVEFKAVLARPATTYTYEDVA
jgi:hypothetical protein